MLQKLYSVPDLLLHRTDRARDRDRERSRDRCACKNSLLSIGTHDRGGSSSSPIPKKVGNAGVIGQGCLDRLRLRLTPPIFPEDAAEAFPVVVPPAVEINFPVESLLKHLAKQSKSTVLLSLLCCFYVFKVIPFYKKKLDYKRVHVYVL